jgi:hypothetical protein
VGEAWTEPLAGMSLNCDSLMEEALKEVEAIARRIALEGHWESVVRKHTCLLGWNAAQLLPERLANNGTCCLVQTRVCRFACDMRARVVRLRWLPGRQR